MAAFSWTPLARAAGAPVVGKLTWYGQSCFLLETAAGTRVLMDPFGKATGYPLPANLRADVVTISHEHPDHNNFRMSTGAPHVLHGLTADKKGWARVEERFRDVSIRSVGVYHDDKRGTARGLDTVFIFEVGGLRIAAPRRPRPHARRRSAGGDRLGRRAAGPGRRRDDARRLPGHRGSSTSCTRA